MAIPPNAPSLPSQPTPLSFPAQTFAKLAPRAYLSAHLNSAHGPHRPSARKPSQSRPPICHTGSLTHANGSAVVRCGDTAVVCGIRAEVLNLEDVPDYVPKQKEQEHQEEEEQDTSEAIEQRRRKADVDEMARLNLLVPNLELATGCSPAHLPGGPPSPLAQTLTQRVLTLLHTSHILSMDDLRIWSQPLAPADTKHNRNHNQEAEQVEGMAGEGKAQLKALWTLYIDILFLSLSGPAFDAAWLAVLASLRTTRLPHAYYSHDHSAVLCSPLISDSKLLSLFDYPVPLSFGVFFDDGDGGTSGGGGKIKKKEARRWILADPDGFEEGICREVGTVVVGKGERVVRIEKNGGVGVGREEMGALVRLARVRREEWMRVLGVE